MDLKDRAQQLKKDIPAIFLALNHKATPVMVKVLAGITIGYALSPIDLIPDYIPVLGYLDDVIILPFLVAITIKFIPKDVFDECRVKAEGMWSDGKPKKWYYAIPVLLVWMFVILFIIRKVISGLIK